MGRQAERVEGVIDCAKLEHREQQPERDEEDYRVEKEEWREEHARDDTKPSPRWHALGMRARTALSRRRFVRGAQAGKIARKTR